jgi:sugar phosphate isomerase/epimerase
MDVSLQLYSLREQAPKGLPAILEMTHKAGYSGVEFAGYFDQSPQAMNDLLKKYHLKAVSSHVGIDLLRTDFRAQLDYAKALGMQLLVCPGMGCDTREQTVANARFLEDCAKQAAAEGLTLGYHNHSHEFTTQFDGTCAMDIILETAPTLRFQPDVFWVTLGGVDPVTYLRPLAKAGRICAIHAKELAKDGKKNGYVGEGTIDFKTLSTLCPGDRYPYIVEQEEFSGDPLDGITRSCQGLRAVLGG